MNESVETRLRKYRTTAPPEALRGAILASLPARRSSHFQKAVLRASVAFLALTLFWAYGMETGTATRMAAAMGVTPAPQAADSGILARLLTPSPLLPLSPRTPASGYCLVAAAASEIKEGDLPCVY